MCICLIAICVAFNLKLKQNKTILMFFLRRNPSEKRVILIFGGKKPCARIILKIIAFFSTFFKGQTRENRCQISMEF